MATHLTFALKDTKKGNPTYIYVRFKIKGKRFVWSLGRHRKIHPDLWDDKTQRPINTRKASSEKERNHFKYIINKFKSDNPDIKTELENISTRIESVRTSIKGYLKNTLDEGKELDYRALKLFLDEKYTPIKLKDKESEDEDYKHFVTAYYQRFVEGIEDRSILIDSGQNHGQEYSKGTVKTYKTSFEVWKRFEKTKSKKLRWQDIDRELYNSLIQFCNQNNFKGNYQGRVVRHLKVTLRRAYEEGIHNYEDFKKKYFRAAEYRIEPVVLTANEIEKIRLQDLSDQPERYDLYRDVFLIGCYTALRYSDFSRLRPDHIKGNYIDIINKKNNKRVKIPIHPHLRQILEKYDFKIPKTHAQHLNEIIKDVAKLAEINEPVEVKEIKGGMTVTTTKPKYELIKSHTARKSAATLLYLDTHDALGVMKITGHATQKDFMRYINIDVDQNAERLKESRFFSPLKKVQ